jgi:UDP-N-acetylmuramoyl-L-alanyl-D-glutamate--2,6-diaminopimelate ligase
VTIKPVRIGGVSLRSLLASDLVARPHDVRASSCTSDFRRVRQGDVFVALVEAEEDGHDFATEAVRRGAAAVVCERCLPVFTVPQYVVRDSRAAYGRICQALVAHPSRQLKVIGVTGTSGKTTVARLLASIFRTAGIESGTIDSLGCSDGLNELPAVNDKITPTWLARRLSDMAANGLTHAIVEVSSQSLSQSLLAGVRLDAMCVTHIGHGHLDWHGSVENYRQAERRVLEHLDPDGVAILNADCPVSMRMLDGLRQPVLTIGLRQPSEITAQVIEQHVNEQVFLLTAGEETVGVRTSLVGDHQIYNCLTAAAMALAYGVELTTIARGLEAVDQLPGRMERVMCGQEFNVLVDAANSPETLRACLQAARQVTSGRLICVVGADGESNRDELPALGRVAGAMADLAVITSNGPRVRGQYDFTREIVNGFADPKKAHVILERSAAIAWAIDNADEGDTVIVAGMGDRLHPTGGENELPCDDSALARQVLQGAFASTAPHRVAA